MQRAFAALFLLLTLLFCLAEGASARAMLQPENRVGVFSSNPNIRTYEIDPLALELQWEDTTGRYDIATGVVFYVNQNPWTHFDPEGLSIWTNAYKLLKNGGDIGMTTAGLVADWKVATNPRSSFLTRFGSFWSMGSELLPVSARDAKAGYKGAKNLLTGGDKVESAGDTVKATSNANDSRKAAGSTTETAKGRRAETDAEVVAPGSGDAHVYGVIDTQTGTLTKPGMSKRPFPDRMDESVAKADERAGQAGRHKGVLIEDKISPEQARGLEQKLTDKVEVRRPGTFPNKFHQRPTPKVKTKEQFKEKYGHEHNQGG